MKYLFSLVLRFVAAFVLVSEIAWYAKGMKPLVIMDFLEIFQAAILISTFTTMAVMVEGRKDSHE